VVDWIGGATAARYQAMAEREVAGISPSYAALCLGVATDAALLARLDTLPAPKRQPNLLLGAVRFLDGPVDAWPAFRAFAMERWDDIAATMLARRTQTNEAGRCAVLLPVLAALPQPLALLEVGASAGLCLLPDRYAYLYTRPPRGRGSRPTVLGDSQLVLRCVTDGPRPQTLPEVVWRAGLDLNPLDVRDDEDVRWLRSLIWPEQTGRFATLDGAVEIARRDPPRVVVGDLLTDVGQLAAEAPADATLVIFHSAVLAYVPADVRSGFADQVAAIAADRPTVWLSNEAPGVVVDHPATPGSFVLARDGEPLALTRPHGQALEWLS
jgi:hypothetical protein